MVAKAAKSASEASSPAAGGSKRFKGVRMRSWGKWVSEIRLPNTRARLWLGSYATAEQAARAYDVAVTCLRGSSASLNFPDSPPVYAPVGLPHHQIQELAAATAVAPAPPSLSSAEEQGCDSTGSQLDSLLTSPGRSTFAEESDAAKPQIDASSQCSSPVSTPPNGCAPFVNLLSQSFSSPPEIQNSEWDMNLADELQSAVFGFSHWEQHISGITVSDSIIVPLLDDDYPAFAEPYLWSL